MITILWVHYTQKVFLTKSMTNAHEEDWNEEA